MHERISINIANFPGDSLEAAMVHWRELQPQRIGIFTSHVTAKSLPGTKALLDNSPFAVESAIHLFIPNVPLSDRNGWEPARSRLSEAIEGIAAVGGKSMYILSGSRGQLTWEDAAQAFAEAISPCVCQAQQAGVLLLMEPMGMLLAQHHMTHSLRDTVKLAKIAGIGVCMDIFHCWAEAGLHETIADASSLIGLVQVGDYVLGDSAIPCRTVVGEGDIPIERILRWTLAAGYKGAFDLEVTGPRVDKIGRVEALRRSALRLSEIISAHGP